MDLSKVDPKKIAAALNQLAEAGELTAEELDAIQAAGGWPSDNLSTGDFTFQFEPGLAEKVTKFFAVAALTNPAASDTDVFEE